MITFTVTNSDSDSDLEVFRLVAPAYGKFVSLVATKQPRYPSAETHIEFEYATLVLHCLNIGYTGGGPKCMEQILVELGADREIIGKAIESHQIRFQVERSEKSKIFDSQLVKWIPVGGDLIVPDEVPKPDPED